MPYLAKNKVAVSSNWTPGATFQWPFQGSGAVVLSGFVNSTDVVVQALEAGEAFTEDESQEILLRQGFNSEEFRTPIVAWRFKVWKDTLLLPAGTVDMRAKA